MTVMADEQDSTWVRKIDQLAAQRMSSASAPDSTGGVAQRPQIPRSSGARPVASSPVTVDPLMNPDPLIFGAGPVPAGPNDADAPAPSSPAPVAAADPVRAPAPDPVERSGFLDSVAGIGAGLRGDAAFRPATGSSTASAAGWAARRAGNLGTASSGIGLLSPTSALGHMSQLMHGVDVEALAMHTGVGLQAAAMMAKEGRGEKPTDVASEERKDYVAADMQRMVARSRPMGSGGKFKSAAIKALAAERLGDAVQAGGHRAGYESTMDVSEKVNDPRPETSDFTRAMQVAALPGDAIDRTGGVMMNVDDGRHDLLGGNYSTALAMSGAGLVNEGAKAAISTAGHVAAPVLGSVAATTAYKYGLGPATKVAGKLLAAPFRALGGNDQDQADAYDKQWDGGTSEDRDAGTAETRAGEILRRGFRSRGQATGDNAVGWGHSGAKDSRDEVHRTATVDPNADNEEPSMWGRFANWAGSTWLGKKAGAASRWLGHKAYDFVGAPLQSAWTSTKGLASRAWSGLTNWWGSRQDRSGPNRSEELNPDDMAGGEARDESAEYQDPDHAGLEELDPDAMV